MLVIILYKDVDACMKRLLILLYTVPFLHATDV